jgi:hypothetical protein
MFKTCVVAMLLFATGASIAAQPKYDVASAVSAAPSSTPANPVAPPPLALVGANVPPAEPLLPFGDFQDWILFAPLQWTIGATHDSITVPIGFVTDLASIPQMLWSIGLRPEGQYSRAAIVHDYLYWSQNCTREQADHLLLIAMKESNVGTIQEDLIYAAVHTAGGSAWDNNAKEKKAGLVRILPPEVRNPNDPNMIWSVYRAQLFKQGVTGVPDPADTSYCHDGDSSAVPKT